MNIGDSCKLPKKNTKLPNYFFLMIFNFVYLFIFYSENEILDNDSAYRNFFDNLVVVAVDNIVKLCSSRMINCVYQKYK